MKSAQHRVMTGFLALLVIGITSPLAGQPGQDDASRPDNVDAEQPAAESEAADVPREVEAEFEQSQNPVDEGKHDDKHQIHIMGMTVVHDEGWPLVLDVIATSPAWDGGIREGDRIIAVESVRGRPYDKWAEAIRRIVPDKSPDDPIAVSFSREGEQFDVRLQPPTEQRPGDGRRPQGPAYAAAGQQTDATGQPIAANPGSVQPGRN